MMETEEISETLVFNSKLPQLIVREDFRKTINPAQDMVQLPALVNTIMKLRSRKKKSWVFLD
jgi:hypothetical protein